MLHHLHALRNRGLGPYSRLYLRNSEWGLENCSPSCSGDEHEYDMVREVGVGGSSPAGLVSHDKECGFVLGAKEVTGRI